jgi:hypothetical protein
VDESIPVPFLASNFQWPQPNGIGNPITISYSYSNLLGGSIANVSDQELRAATEEALLVWAAYAPIDFIEVEDTGPNPTESENSYAASNHAEIRIGAHTIDGSRGGELAHAYFPFSTTEGLAGDLHLDADEDWTRNNGGYLVEVLLHEIGHVLGLEHVDNVDAIMNPFIVQRFNGVGQADLLVDDVDGIRSIYGSGVGSVTPLTPTDEPTDEPSDEPSDEPRDYRHIGQVAYRSYWVGSHQSEWRQLRFLLRQRPQIGRG